MRAIGIDVGGTKLLAAIVESGSITRKVVRATEEASSSQVIELVEAIDEGAGMPVGVAIAGWVSHPAGGVAFAPNLPPGWERIGAELADALGRQIAIENDAAAAALAEHRFGNGHASSQMIMVTVGTGIGGGAIIAGELYRGHRGFASEFGHMQIDPTGPVCPCGLTGCLEAMASGTAIAAAAALRWQDAPILSSLSAGDPSSITGAMVGDAAEAGDQVCIEVIASAGKQLGVGLHALTMAFDPEVIVVGGGVASSGDLFIAPAIEELNARMQGRASPPRVLPARLGNDAGAIGAATIAWEGTDG